MDLSKVEITWYRLCVYLLVILRIITAFFIFSFVVETTVVQLVLDLIDGEFFKRAGISTKTYQLFDKLLDYYWYVIILIYIITNPVPHLYLFIFLFTYRTVGKIIFFFTHNRTILFLFPNFFETLFWVYTASLVYPSLITYLYPPGIMLMFAIITPFVLIREYIIHIAKLNLSKIFLGNKVNWADERKIALA